MPGGPGRSDAAVDAFVNREVGGGRYDADVCAQGAQGEATIVTFLGGVFLDALTSVREQGGYYDYYREFAHDADFSGAHHTIGLGANWDRWPTLGEWVADAAEVNEFEDPVGGYVRRKELTPLSAEFVEEVNDRHADPHASAAELFLEILHGGPYESTIDPDG